MTAMTRALRCGAATLACGLAAAAGGAEAPRSAAELSAQGGALAAQGRCEEAIPLLERAHADDPSDVAALLANAQCQIRLRRYAEARAILTPLHESGPPAAVAGEVDLYLAIAAYHLGDLAAAREALERARATAPERAETHLYAGILAFQADEYAVALQSFQRAREIDPARADPMASYYAGVTRARLGERKRAREDLRRVLEAQPSGPWADRARTLLARLERRDATRPWKLEVTTGLESDDNVVLRGDDVTLPEEISDEGDERLMWRVNGNSQLLRGDAGAVGVTGDYTGTLHRQLNEFDLQYPAAALWWRRAVGERNTARVEYRFGHAWVDSRAFVTTHSFGPSLVHQWPQAGRSTMRVRAFGFVYRDEPSNIDDGAPGGLPGDACPPETPSGSPCGAFGVDESKRRDRTGAGYELFGGHSWSLPWRERAIELRPGLRFQQYFAAGNEASYLRVEPRLDTRIALPLGLSANTDLSYAYRPYRASTSLPEPGTAAPGVQIQPFGHRRHDNIVRVSLGLERTFGRVTAEARYTFQDNHSNFAASDYERNIFGLYLTGRLGN